MMWSLERLLKVEAKINEAKNREIVEDNQSAEVLQLRKKIVF